MEKYNQFDHHSSSQRRNFPAYPTSPPNTNPNHHPNMNMNMNMNMNTFIQANPNYFHSPEFYSHQVTAVKREVAGTSQDQLHNTSSGISNSKNEMEAMKAKIIDHPQYSNLLEAYIDCQKVGASPEVAAKLSAIRQEYESRQGSLFSRKDDSKDPELDQFMGSYYDMLVKYREELTRPVQEAMEFMSRIESQLSLLSNGGSRIIPSDERSEGIGSSEDEQENSNGETELPEIDPRVEDRELKNRLLKKYSGCLSNLKQELSKKKKKGKLPKEARQKLLSWWELHYKWPYPSESEKLALAEATGLDQKQINNWFINQRKRHWKPSEDMQFVVMDGLHHPHTTAAFYMEGHFTGNAPYRFGT